MASAPTSSSDDELMRAFIAGDTAAMEALFDRHRKAVFGWLVRHAADRAEAEDLYQEAWLRIIRGAGAYEPGNFAAWMWRIVRNLAADRAKKMKPALILDAPVDCEDGDSLLVDTIEDSAAVHALDGMEAAERRQRVGAAIGRLSAALKEVVTLRINAELEFREIAEMLNLPLGTVLARMHNAVAKLKQMILAETTRSDFNAETQSRAFQKDKNQNER